ncbi:MAG TPA: PIN domain-containing protein [Coriobacteriia bacterium]
MRIVVIDTNVLLSQPEVINSFHDADVVIPEMVLSEIDKLKIARVDPELRYKGRQVSRILFELSEMGSLHDGVELANGSALRIVGLGNDLQLPPGLSSKNTDDRILAVAVRLQGEGDDHVTLVTNDLNMLIKAQSFHLNVERVETDDGFMRRFVVHPFQRYRSALGILAVAFAVFAAAIYLTLFSPFAAGRQATGLSDVPAEFVEQLSIEHQQQLNYLFRLEASPNDIEARTSLATVYDSLSQENSTYLPFAIKHWEIVVQKDPKDADARTDLATDYFRSGKIDLAIREVRQVLAADPEHFNANFNLAVFLMSTDPKDFQGAADQLQLVIKMANGDPARSATLARAQTLLEQIKKDAATAGVTLRLGGGSL